MLLTPEATPDRRSLTDPITTVVSGATLNVIPTPRMTMPGMKPETNRAWVPGKASATKPSAVIPGPRVRIARGLYLRMRSPATVEPNPRINVKGRKAAPAWSVEYPCTCIRSKGKKYSVPLKAPYSSSVIKLVPLKARERNKSSGNIGTSQCRSRQTKATPSTKASAIRGSRLHWGPVSTKPSTRLPSAVTRSRVPQ